MEKSKFCSIIITHYTGSDPESSMEAEERSAFLRACLESLWEHTQFPYELIVVDNGGSLEDSQWLLESTDMCKITTYIRNSNNMHFGYARNQALDNSHGDYICIMDNDILLEKDWLTECISVLDAFPKKKIYTTPMPYPTPIMKERYSVGKLSLGNKELELSMRAGSNCYVVRRQDFDRIGRFMNHRIAGSLWTDGAVKMGFLACVLSDRYAKDLGLRRGYNVRKTKPIFKNITNGEKVYFNQDEFVKNNPDKEYRA